jgi:hypothetical protein
LDVIHLLNSLNLFKTKINRNLKYATTNKVNLISIVELIRIN